MLVCVDIAVPFETISDISERRAVAGQHEGRKTRVADRSSLSAGRASSVSTVTVPTRDSVLWSTYGRLHAKKSDESRHIHVRIPYMKLGLPPAVALHRN